MSRVSVRDHLGCIDAPDILYEITVLVLYGIQATVDERDAKGDSGSQS